MILKSSLISISAEFTISSGSYAILVQVWFRFNKKELEADGCQFYVEIEIVLFKHVGMNRNRRYQSWEFHSALSK